MHTSSPHLHLCTLHTFTCTLPLHTFTCAPSTHSHAHFLSTPSPVHPPHTSSPPPDHRNQATRGGLAGQEFHCPPPKTMSLDQSGTWNMNLERWTVCTEIRYNSCVCYTHTHTHTHMHTTHTHTYMRTTQRSSKKTLNRYEKQLQKKKQQKQQMKATHAIPISVEGRHMPL